MITTNKPYYCYTENGKPVIKEEAEKPENFDELPLKHVTHCPDSRIAELSYRTFLRVHSWRTN